MNAPALTCHNLSFAYGATPILKEVTLSVQAGEFIAIFGPNGGGKTTLLHLIMGFLKPTKGSIQLFGKPPKAVRHKLGWVPQHFHFDPHFPISVQEVVLEGCLTATHGRADAADQRTARAVLERVAMQHALHAPFASLSGGQQQRVLIARALAAHPTLLLLDEPTASIDPQAAQAIYALLDELHGKMTLIMVTHKLTQILPSVDRLFCVDTHVTPIPKEKVCDHFALGLYHPPEPL